MTQIPAADAGLPAATPATRTTAPGGTSVLGALLRFPVTSLLLVLLVVAASGAVGLLTQGATAATASMALTTPSSTSLLAPGSTSDAGLSRYASQRAAFATSDAVLAAVARTLPDTSASALRRRVTATVPTGTSTVAITADAGTRAGSVWLANAVVRTYQDQTRDQVGRLTTSALTAISTSEVDAQQRLAQTPTGAAAQAAATTLGSLQQQAASLVVEQSVYGDGVEFAQAAVPAPAPSLPVRDLALGLAVGLALAAVVAWLRADRDPRVSDGAAVASLTGVPLLGSVVEDADLAGASPDRLPSPGYATVAPAMVLRAGDGVVLVTSAARRAGRTTTALNLAAAAAREGRRVLVVDADLSAPSLSAVVGLAGASTGLGTLLTGPEPSSWRPELAAEVTTATGHRLHVLPAGPGDHPDREVDVPRLRDLLATLRSEYDLVVVDAAPLLAGGVPALLARLVDGALVVVRRGGTAETLSRTAELLELYGTPVLGAVLTFAVARESVPAR